MVTSNSFLSGKESILFPSYHKLGFLFGGLPPVYNISGVQLQKILKNCKNKVIASNKHFLFFQNAVFTHVSYDRSPDIVRLRGN